MKAENEDMELINFDPPSGIIKLESNEANECLISIVKVEVEEVLEEVKTFISASSNDQIKEEKQEIGEIIELGEYAFSENIQQHVESQDSNQNAASASKNKISGKKIRFRKESKFQCKACSKIFKFKDALRQHEGLHDKKFKCEYCLKKSATQGKLNAHAKDMHVNPMSYTCDICNKRFNKKYILTDHIKIHDKNRVKRFNCEKCGYATDKRIVYVHHMETHKVGSKSTGKIQKKNPNIKTKNHRKIEQSSSSHETAVKKSKSPTKKEGEYECKMCLKLFKNKKSLRQHEGLHNKKFQCEFCFKKFPTKGKINAHIRDMHEHPMRYTCDVCNKKFNKKFILKDHMKIHDKNRVKRFNCQYCGYGTDKNKVHLQHLARCAKASNGCS